MEKEGKKRK